MATFDASNIVSGNALQADVVEGFLEELAVRYQTAEDNTTVYSTSSSSSATLLHTTITNIETNDLIVVIGKATSSCGSAGHRGILNPYIDSVIEDGYIARFREPYGATDGQSSTMTVAGIATGLSGSVDVGMDYRAIAPATHYVRSVMIIALVFKNAGTT